jgi:hypothetical protein
MHAWTARGSISLGLLAALIVVAGCTSDGHFRFLGYTTEPNYDPSIRTVYVSMAKNVTFRQELEDYLTRAVIREINLKTPMRTVSNRDIADTELCLRIVNWRKTVLIPTPTNQNRQAELGLGVEVMWKDLRPGCVGDILSNPKTTLAQEPPLPGMPPPPPGMTVPVLLLPAVTYEPELGPSNATAEQQAIDRVAVQIASMMERPW